MTAQPVLELESACPATEHERAAGLALDLRLMPGELALIDADGATAEWLADFAIGLIPPHTGHVRFLGHDWSTMPPDYAAALRGAIGRWVFDNGWLRFLDTATNIMLPQLHHTSAPLDDVRAAAARLASAFGLPGLPLDPPSTLAALDLARAACVRLFLGAPALLVLDQPFRAEQFDVLATPLLTALAEARQRGAAAIWLTRAARVWNDGSIGADHRLRLRQHGLSPAAEWRPA